MLIVNSDTNLISMHQKEKMFTYLPLFKIGNSFVYSADDQAQTQLLEFIALVDCLQDIVNTATELRRSGHFNYLDFKKKIQNTVCGMGGGGEGS